MALYTTPDDLTLRFVYDGQRVTVQAFDYNGVDLGGLVRFEADGSLTRLSPSAAAAELGISVDEFGKLKDNG